MLLVMRHLLVSVPLLALLLVPATPAEAATRKCGKPAGWTKDGRIKSVNLR